MMDNDWFPPLFGGQGRTSVRHSRVLSRQCNQGFLFGAVLLLAGLTGCGSEQSDLVQPNSVRVSLNITMPEKVAAASNTRNNFWATLQRWLFPTEAWAAGSVTDLSFLRVDVSAADLLTPVSGEVSGPFRGNVVTIPLDVPVGSARVFTVSGLDATRARIFLGQSDAVTLNVGQASTVDITLGALGPAGSLTDARGVHTATRLQNGKVLVVGGFSNELQSNLASAELYDPMTNRWTRLATGLLDARSFHAATLLQNGKVVVVGGSGGDGSLASTELFDPVTQQWTQVGSLNEARPLPNVMLLPNGKVLVVGGSSPSAELFDPVTQQWTLVGSLSEARVFHTATLLPNGKVLVVGGHRANSSPILFGPVLASAELFDPVTQQWTLVGSLKGARASHTATLLPNGKVLVAGGFNQQLQSTLASAELFDPGTQQWTSVGSLTDPRSGHEATPLPNGQVLVVGDSEGDGIELTSVELFDPVTQQWRKLATGLAEYRGSSLTATLLQNGQVLVVGGTVSESGDDSASLASAEVLDLSLL